jgi:Cdc6-like AAA superfamily ATPase
VKILESIQDKLKQSLKAVDGLYCRLILLVGDVDSGKTVTLHEIADELCVPVINVNLEISSKLLELTAKQRTLHLPRLLEEITERGNSTLVLDNLEILFDKEMKQDPLRLLERISRNYTVIASWNGSAEGGKLRYAEVGHPEYQSYDHIDALIVDMDGTTTVDLSN